MGRPTLSTSRPSRTTTSCRSTSSPRTCSTGSPRSNAGSSTARFGLDGRPVVSMKQLQHELGLPRAELRTALGDGLAKVRAHLA